MKKFKSYKEEKQFFIEMGKEDYKNGVPHRSNRSEAFKKIWKKVPLACEYDLCKKYDYHVRLWESGWATASSSVKNRKQRAMIIQ